MVVSKAFFGAANNKLIVKDCEETKAIINGSMQDITYHLYNSAGQYVKVTGAYVIADAGFLRIWCMADPTHAL